MSTDAAITALVRYNQTRSEAKKDAVRAVVARDGHGVEGRRQVARHAGVSREFINTHPDLKELIDAAAAAGRRRRLHAEAIDRRQLPPAGAVGVLLTDRLAHNLSTELRRHDRRLIEPRPAIQRPTDPSRR